MVNYQVEIDTRDLLKGLAVRLRTTRVNLDGQHKQLMKELKKKGTELVGDLNERPAERGSRPLSRETGKLFGPRNRVKGSLIGAGSGRKVKGFIWPDPESLRNVKHWRTIEEGREAGYFLPPGAFVDSGDGARFMFFSEIPQNRKQHKVLWASREWTWVKELPPTRLFSRTWDAVINEDSLSRRYGQFFEKELSDFGFTYKR